MPTRRALFEASKRPQRLAKLLDQVDELLGKDRASAFKFIERLLVADDPSRLLLQIRQDGLDVGRIVRHLRLAVLSALELAPAPARGCRSGAFTERSIERLAQVYRAATGKRATAIRDGPFERFVTVILDLDDPQRLVQRALKGR